MKQVISDTNVPIKIWTNDIEQEAIAQLRNVASLPFIYKWVVAMPDVHAGKGSTVGTVLATQGAIIPACVGVDIGCGMSAMKTEYKVNELGDLSKLRHSIERSVPTGFNVNKHWTDRTDFEWKKLGPFSEIFDKNVKNPQMVIEKARRSIGTLGGGNHFIEICTDENSNVWILLHTGSRNLGKIVADIHIKNAQYLMDKFFIELPHKDLAFLPQGLQEFDDYMNDLNICQKFAKTNRFEIMCRVYKDIVYHVENILLDEDEDWDRHLEEMRDCHHNYVAIENHFGKNVFITRKGAISSREGEFGIIPGSMGTRSYIVKGLGNPDSFMSSSHGAGRKMSRTQAKKIFTKEDIISQTEGVECVKTLDIVDELPGSYKDIDVVMENQKDLVIPITTLKQLLCIKGIDK